MSRVNNRSDQESATNPPDIYQIRVEGHLDLEWADWFENLKIEQEENDSTLITGPIVDDSALHGLLKKIRDSGLRLISVNRIENDAGG
jgi:hypothetical protein